MTHIKHQRALTVNLLCYFISQIYSTSFYCSKSTLMHDNLYVLRGRSRNCRTGGGGGHGEIPGVLGMVWMPLHIYTLYVSLVYSPHCMLATYTCYAVKIYKKQSQFFFKEGGGGYYMWIEASCRPV